MPDFNALYLKTLLLLAAHPFTYRIVAMFYITMDMFWPGWDGVPIIDDEDDDW
ncbi:hypothetical protein BDV18DRAFT_160450 [Aspergillus unguis]